MNIVAATTAHIPLIRAITFEVWPPTYTHIIGETQLNYMLNRFYTPEALTAQMEEMNHRFFIGYEDGAAVAFASFSEIQEGIYKLHKLYALTGMQRKGLGYALLMHVVNTILEEKSTAELRLNVNRHNERAIAFYKRVGFTHYADEDIDIGSGYFMNDHILQLALLK